ncbi:DoxX family protein [Actinomadura sp. KC216]|uniref:DoxX family protein n=1 Tax=Actinomadura sp. KC216 TaxID=2530370 RepID=UPI0010496B8A|nr:DoxX family protein [Actinomadura sp. KC216]TDB85123.1 DoxX family protein [Actinomadura sp. KC216]
MRSRPMYDVVAALARLGVGLVFIAHGWQKIEAGITATGRTFDDLGVPLPTAAAVYAAFAELLGGAALIAGLALPVTGLLLFADMAGAFLFVHADQGLFIVDGTRVENGYELVLVLGMASLLFAAGAGGRLTLDQWIATKRLRRSDDDEDDAASFVKSLRQAEPQTETETGTKPHRKHRARRSTKKSQPAEPTEPPAAPEESEDDLLVAGPRKAARRHRARGTRQTEPATAPAAEDKPEDPA